MSALNKLLEPIQSAFQASSEWQDIEKLAYPPPPPVVKPEKKKKKDRGTMFPGNVQVKPDGHVERPDAAKVNLGAAQASINDLSIDDKKVEAV